MAKREVYKNFVDLPQGIQNFLLKDVEDFYDKLIADYKLSEDSFFESFDAPVLDSIMGLATFNQAITKVGQFVVQAKLDPEDQKKIIVQLIEHVYWPIRDLFDKELLDFVREEQVDTSIWPQKRVLYKPISYAGAVSELINRLSLHSAGQQMRDRLRDLLVSFAKGVRVADQIKEIMLRQTDLGGLGFDQRMTDLALSAIRELTQTVQIMDEQTYSDYLAEEMKSSAVGQDDKGRERTIKDAGQEVDDQIENIKAKLPATPKAVTELDKAVSAIWERIPNKPQDEYLVNRLRNVISSRLRDVRNSGELLGLLQRDSKVGGMGLDKAAADEMAKVIETSYEEFRSKIESEEHGKLETQLTEQRKKIEEKRKKEAEEHALWYEEKIKKRQSADSERQQLTQALKKGFESRAIHPIDLKNAAIEKKQYGELVPAGQHLTLNIQHSISDQEKGRGTTVRVSAVTAAMARQPTLRVDGVQPSALKLHGLAEEIGGMTLSGFRRLGKTPKDAAAKITQRFDTLGEESFEQKVSAVKAWQTSPISKMYLDLVTQSFKSGKPIAELAEERRKAGEDSLTRDEIEALINLNNTLHY
ncbi:MAG: hypothetical protein WC750_03750 [Patescibacteria group bacterium]|jgi:hypothetical protein